MERKPGHYLFIVGVIIAAVLGLAAPQLGDAADWLWSLLVVLGIFVGFLNISGKESKDFLWITVALVLISYAGQTASWEKVHVVGPFLESLFDTMLAFIVPAAIVAALKEAWYLARG